MKLRILCLLALLPALLAAQSRSGAAPDANLRQVRLFADTLLANGLDRYGAKQTPAWVSMLDLKTRRIPESKDPNWQRSYDAEDYMRNARGSNLYRDIATIQMFLQLSERTGDGRYARAANEYLSWFMANCASPTTGLFAWGEHMFYNVVREEIEANRHELERQLPPWEEMWRLNPEAVRREIEGIYQYHIHDKETFNFDRHGNYYTGKFDDPQVRGPYTKHSGLYAYSFLFLYTKTKEPKYLEWALKAGLMFYKVRNPQTNLVGGYWAPVQAGPTNLPGHLAWYLFHAYRLDRAQTQLRDAAGVMLKAYLRAAWDPGLQRFHREVNVADAKPQPGLLSPWGDGQGETGMFGQATLMAYQDTGDAEFLTFAKSFAKTLLDEGGAQGLHPETSGKNLNFLMDMYAATKETAYLRAARRFAARSVEVLFQDGLIKESPDGYIYSSASGAGELAKALLRLSAVDLDSQVSASAEDRFPVDSAWNFPRLVKSGATAAISVKVSAVAPGSEVTLAVAGGSELKPVAQAGGVYRFQLATATGEETCRFSLRIRVPGSLGWQSRSGEQTMWLSQSGTFPNIEGDGRPLAGVEKMAAQSLGGGSLADALPWLFRVPASAAASTMRVKLTEAEVDPFLAASVRLYRQVGAEWRAVPGGMDPATRVVEAKVEPGLYAVRGEPRLRWRLPTDGAMLLSPLVADFRGGRDGLQIAVATNDIDRSLYLLRHDGSRLWQFSVKGPLSHPVLVRTASGAAIAFSSLDTLYLVNGEGEEIWSRKFQGRLQAPAFADGRIYAASSAGELAVLDLAGAVVWRHAMSQAIVTSPVVAEFGRRVILVGGADAKLHALAEGQGEIWAAEARGGRFLPPAVGDIDGDGQAEIVFAAKSVSTNHEVVALKADGRRLWSYEAHREGEWAPVLADMQGLGYKQVIVETELAPWPKCELTILDREGKRLRGIAVHSRLTQIPVVLDLDGDGKSDLLFPCNEDRRMHAVNNAGESLWSFAPKSLNFAGAKMKGGGTPAVADVDGDGRLEVVVGDDETVLNCIRTGTRVAPRAIVSGEFRGSGAHAGN